MNAYDTLRALAHPHNPAVQGHWFNIRLIPDPGTGERLNVGVGFIGPDGAIQTRFLEDFRHLECLYADRLDLEHLRFLFQVARAAWAKATVPTSPSPQMQISALKYAAGDSAASILDELYLDTVTAQPSDAPPTDADKPETLDTPGARRLVFDAMKRKNPWSSRIIAEAPEWPVSEADSTQVLDMPIRAPKRFGNVLSAWYRSRQSLEVHLLRGTIDLDTAQRINPGDSGALFLLRPPTAQRGFTEAQHQQIDNVIDAIAWRLRLQKLHLDVEETPDKLAERVLSWADMAA